jgi:predicted DNA-binding transcriptional regulator AlpA
MISQAIASLNDAQREFDSKYITASEIMKDLGITRPTLKYARSTNKLPEPIVLNDGTLFVWERETVRPYLDAWKAALMIRRGI